MPRYQIVDYTYPTAGELARLILVYKGVEFDDEQIESPDTIYEAEQEAPFGTLPILLVDGNVVSQQQGICRYLARQLGLTGKNEEEAAHCDMIMDGLGVVFLKLRGNHFSKLDSKEQLAVIKEVIEEDVPRYLARCEKFLEKGNRKSGYFVSEDLTWCDLGVALTLAGMEARQPELLKNYPLLRTFVDKVVSNDVIRDFVQERHMPNVPEETTSV